MACAAHCAEEDLATSLNPITVYFALRKIQANPVLSVFAPSVTTGAGTAAMTVLTTGAAGVGLLVRRFRRELKDSPEEEREKEKRSDEGTQKEQNARAPRIKLVPSTPQRSHRRKVHPVNMMTPVRRGVRGGGTGDSPIVLISPPCTPTITPSPIPIRVFGRQGARARTKR